MTQRKRRGKTVLPPLAWAAGWARKPDEPSDGGVPLVQRAAGYIVPLPLDRGP